jgi:hypothetical protein
VFRRILGCILKFLSYFTLNKSCHNIINSREFDAEVSVKKEYMFIT